jgi:hypothetical protein
MQQCYNADMCVPRIGQAISVLGQAPWRFLERWELGLCYAIIFILTCSQFVAIDLDAKLSMQGITLMLK